MMKLTWIILLIAIAITSIQCQRNRDAFGADPSSFNEDDESDDFSEFENFDVDDDGFVQPSTSKQENEPKKEKPTNGKSQPEVKNDKFADIFETDDAHDDGVVTDDEDAEFEHFEDDEEFEGFSKTDHTTPSTDQKAGEPKLTMAKVPMHFR